MERRLSFPDFPQVAAGIVKWPMSVLRLQSAEPEPLIALADRILAAWRGYTDEKAFLFAETDGEPHNAITPIARKRGELLELDLVLRNNITTEEFPLGVFHPHPELHHIKKENIGLIEVMGLAVLPSRLKTELAGLEQAIVKRRDIRTDVTPGKTRRLGGWSETAVRIHPRHHQENPPAGNRQGLLPGPGGCRCLQTYPRGPGSLPALPDLCRQYTVNTQTPAK